jgi:nicotinamidase-related amidase
VDELTSPSWDSAALVTIDMQADTLDGQPLEIPGTSAAAGNIARLGAAFRRRRLPIVHVVRLYLADGTNAEPCRQELARGPVPVLRPGTPGSLLAPGLVGDGTPPLDDQLLLAGGVQSLGDSEAVIYKPRWGAFYGTPLDDHLRDAGVTTLVFAGCNFPNCPRTSIYEASERDYRAVLVADAVSGIYDRGIAELRSIGVPSLTTDEVLAELDSASDALAPAQGA